MEKINIIDRFVKSVSDFNFSNTFLKEKISKAIGFMLLGYLLFVLVVGGAALLTIGPDVKLVEEKAVEMIEEMPDFKIENGVFLTNGETKKIIPSTDFTLIVDLESPISEDYEVKYGEYILVTKTGLYSNETELLKFNVIQTSITKAEVLKFPKMITPFFRIGLVFLATLGIIGVFMVSGLVWALVIIMNGFMKKDISSGNCYKIAIYSMVLPGIVTCLQWTMSITLPLAWIIYLALAGVYAYMFMNNYTAEAIDLETIYE